MSTLVGQKSVTGVELFNYLFLVSVVTEFVIADLTVRSRMIGVMPHFIFIFYTGLYNVS